MQPHSPTELPDGSTRPVTLQEAIRAAQQLQRHGELAPAEAIYLQILQQLPAEPNALHYLGVLRHQQGNNDAAIALIEQAIAQVPADPGPWINLGNVLLDAGRYNPAVDAYQRAAELAPDNLLVYNNLGLLQTRRGNPEVAEAAFQHALKLAPDSDYVLHNFARLLHGQRQHERATAYSLQAVALAPGNTRARRLLAVSYALLGDMAAAQDVLRSWLDQEPDHPEARHMLASCGGLPTPARAADAFVAREFDSFATSFDAKLQALNYQAPQWVSQALRQALGPDSTPLGHALDAGCGTGLCGPLLRPWFQCLSGVDLSQGMLDRARHRGCYDALTQAELTAFIAAQPAAYDAIVSADTLCYFGDLQSVAHAVAQALRPGGLLAFSVEALDALPESQQAQGAAEAGYQLRYHGRYQHARAYLVQCLESAGMRVLSLTQETLREELMQPVLGWIVVARREARGTDAYLAGA